MVPAPENSNPFTAVDVNSGNGEVARLLPLVYDELRTLADRYLQQERPNHTLQATALVHEAYMRLSEQKNVHWDNRAQFFSLAATFMRRVLVNHAKHHRRAKRGGGLRRVALEEGLLVTPQPQSDLVALDEALTKLAHVDARKSQMVELRYFAGLSIDEVAELIGVSKATVKRDWILAKAWLLREISEDRDGNT
ncbi:MAG: sigma-70 family RNA polymerase sigma factor [Phycisphaerales bacterium]|nr:sigma-70 family RNA polymerase sigma factor [Phycisphaerales bacterium]